MSHGASFRGIIENAVPNHGAPPRWRRTASSFLASRLVDTLWAWAAGMTTSAQEPAPRLTLRGGRAQLTGCIGGETFRVDLVLVGESLADSDVVVPAAGASVELRPYRRHADLTVLQPTVLTLASVGDWAALERDAAEERPLPNCLVGIAALHLFDPGFRAPNCPRHRQLYRPAVVSATVRRHVCALERERRRALAAIAGSTTNEEWV